MILALLCLSIFFIPAACLADSYPSPIGYVNDFAGFLNVSQKASLESSLSELQRNTTAEVAVATVQSAPDIFNYAVGLFQAWGIGKAANDNGVLVLYAKEQNRIQVVTGYGVEGILPDGKVGRILDESYVPLRDANQTADGIIAATYRIVDIIYANADEVRAGTAGGPPWWVFSLIPLFFIGIFALIGFAAWRASRPPMCPVDKISMKKVRTERASSSIVGYTEIDYFECPKCGRKKERKRSRSSAIFVGGFGGGGGGGFGGFGGGGTGGGGAGR